MPSIVNFCWTWQILFSLSVIVDSLKFDILLCRSLVACRTTLLSMWYFVPHTSSNFVNNLSHFCQGVGGDSFSSWLVHYTITQIFYLTQYDFSKRFILQNPRRTTESFNVFRILLVSTLLRMWHQNLPTSSRAVSARHLSSISSCT